VVLNKDADRTISHSPLDCNIRHGALSRLAWICTYWDGNVTLSLN